jgi:ferredoxin--NADP+ reductase
MAAERGGNAVTHPGSETCPLRVAIVGSGPAGFYAADAILNQRHLDVQVDMFERLPAPFGLVRFGVAPDHERIKLVTRVYDRTAHLPGFRFFGNVEYGRHIHLDDLRAHYHFVCFTTGAQTDRHMGIPGEDLARSHPATEFVAWYNGHPDFRHLTFDLSVERVAVVGVGNVAVDVARILCRRVEELEKTDIADYALDALRRSRVREVYMLGRRGPAQAAFSVPELRDLAELPDVALVVRPQEAEVDEASRALLNSDSDREATKKIELLQELAGQPRAGCARRLMIRFLVSPIELIGNGSGEVAGVRLVRNSLTPGRNGGIRAEPTGELESLPAELVFRSVGYRGVPLPGLPFRADAGVVPNDRGRVLGPDGREPLPGIYVAGWIKRGPTGVIGTNKSDAVETVTCMMRDLESGKFLEPAEPTAGAAECLVKSRQPRHITYADWRRINEIEVTRGKVLGRPRVKFVTAEEMLKAIGR